MRVLLVMLLLVGSAGFVLAQSAATQGTDVQSRIWRAFERRTAPQTDAWFKRGDFPRSVQLLEFRVALFPDNYEEVTNLAWLLESMEMTDQTEAVLTEFYRQNPTMPDASFPIAHFHFRRNNYAETVRYLAPSIRMTPRPHPNTFRTLALAYERLGRLEEAIKVWDLMLSFMEDGAAVNNRARVRQKLEERKEQTTPPSRLNDRSITLHRRWSA